MAVAPIANVASSTLISSSIAQAGKAASAELPFERVINHVLSNTNAHHVQADEAVAQLASGQSENVHDVVLSVAKADLAFRLVLEIRNNLMESYQEIMRMQV